MPSPAASGQERADEHFAHSEALRILQEGGFSPMVGGAYALRAHTGFWRDTKDLDLFIRKDQIHDALAALARHGYRIELTDPLWIGKAFSGPYFIDLIFSSGNGIAIVDEEWARRAPRTEVLGREALIVPVEEIIWSKGFVQERERFDGADIHHLLLHLGATLDWRHLLERFEPHWHVLLSHLVMFRFAFPSARDQVPGWVLRELWEHLQAEERAPMQREKICRGSLVSRQQYMYEFNQGYRDARELEVPGWCGDSTWPVPTRSKGGNATSEEPARLARAPEDSD